MKVRDRLALALSPRLGEQIDQQDRAIRLLAEAYNDGPWVTTPEQLVTQIKEQLDGDMISLLLDQLQYEEYGLQADTSGEQERKTAIGQARQLFRYNPLAQWAINLWTGWGMGDNVSVQFDASDQQGVWDEFFTAQRNRSVMGRKELGELSDWLLVTGNRLLVMFTNTETGATTARLLDEEGVTEIANPNDRSDIWFYKRSAWDAAGRAIDLYYPEWHILIDPQLEEKWGLLRKLAIVSADAARMDQQRTEREVLGMAVPGTLVSVLHIAHNRKDERSPWGWPLTTCATPWLRSHKRFMQARLQVALSKAAIVRQTTVKGGSRAVDSVINSIRSRITAATPSDSNPPPGPGAWHVENEAARTEEKPMTTGASDAKIDWELFSYTALLAMGVFPTSAGMDTSRWATALEMDKAQSMVFGRYNAFWQSEIGEIATAVISLWYHARKQPVPVEIGISVTADLFSLADLPSLASTCAKLTDSMIVPAMQDGALSPEIASELLSQLWRMVLQAFGLPMPEATMVPEQQPPADADQPAESRARATALAIRKMRSGEIDAQSFAEYVRGIWQQGDRE